jgi:hypothetical protein
VLERAGLDVRQPERWKSASVADQKTSGGDYCNVGRPRIEFRARFSHVAARFYRCGPRAD